MRTRQNRTTVASLAAIALAGIASAQTQVRVQGVQEPVEIVRDRDGVPHIKGRSEADVLFGLGYVHAQDRLWQMEYQRRLAAGRLAEVLGPSALGADKLFRTIGLRRNAVRVFAASPPAEQAQARAYAAGINAYLASPSRRLSPEFTMLGLEPETWAPEDVLLTGSLLTWSGDKNWDEELLRVQLAQRVGPERAAQLMPAYSTLDPTTIDVRSPVYPERAFPILESSLSRENGASLSLAGLLALKRTLTEQFGVGGQGRGSNAWALSGARTVTGKPLLAGDPHLDTQAPNQFYMAHLTAPGFSVSGGTVPGSPGVVIGRNSRIAWTITNSNSDVQDLYVEHVDERNFVEYQGSWEPLELIPEVIAVKGAGPVAIQVRISRHGPLISDVINPSGPALAVRWSGADARGGVLGSIMAANHARNWDEFVAAFRDHESPTQNVVYADIDGNIGYLLACRIPIRAAGDGTSPVPGWTGTYEWSGYVPFERRPRAFNPPEGYIVSANNRIAGDGYPYRLGNGFAAPFRAVRIHEMITARPLHSADDMAAMQSDVLAVHARQLLPLLLETRPESDRAARALELLRHWDSQVVADSAPAAIFEAWYRALGRRMFQDELGEQLWPVYSQSIYFVGMALPDALRAHTQWCDDVRTPRRESCGDTMAAAFEDGLTEMAAAQHTEDPVRWKWGKVHPAVFPHRPFGDAPRFKRSIENEGDRFTVNVGSAFEWETYEQHHGAVYRQIVDLSPGARSRFIIPLGQSGDARDPHYDDLLERWRNCEYLPMTEAATGAASRLMLVP